MAKQRKLLYPSVSNSFFDDMEAEMVNTKKRKSCKSKPENVPPEKLFLQFDPSKNGTGFYPKKKVDSQPLGMQKTQWKPPIKKLPQPEYQPSCKVNSPRNRCSEEKENLKIKSSENVKEVVSSNYCNIDLVDLCLEEHKMKSKEHTEIDMENNDIVSINSSQEKYSPESELRDRDLDHNDHEGSKTNNELLNQQTEIFSKQLNCGGDIVVNIDEKEDGTTEKDYSQKLAFDVTLTNNELEPDKTSTPCQDLCDVESEDDRPITTTDTITTTLRDNFECQETIDVWNVDMVSKPTKEYALREELCTEIRVNNDNKTINQTQSSKKDSDTNEVELQESIRSEKHPSKPMANYTKSDESKIINEKSLNKADVLCEVKHPESYFKNIHCSIGVEETKTMITVEDVFEDSQPEETTDIQIYEISKETNEDNKLNLIYSINMDSPENCCISRDSMSENKASNINVDKISLVKNDNVMNMNGLVSYYQNQTLGNNLKEICENKINSDEADNTSANKECPISSYKEECTQNINTPGKEVPVNQNEDNNKNEDDEICENKITRAEANTLFPSKKDLNSSSREECIQNNDSSENEILIYINEEGEENEDHGICENKITRAEDDGSFANKESSHQSSKEKCIQDRDSSENEVLVHINGDSKENGDQGIFENKVEVLVHINKDSKKNGDQGICENKITGAKAGGLFVNEEGSHESGREASLKDSDSSRNEVLININEDREENEDQGICENKTTMAEAGALFGNKENSHPSSREECMQNRDFSENEVLDYIQENNEENEDEDISGKINQLLEEEENISGEKMDMDEEYSCFISDSQLEEIERNYYESYNHTPAKESTTVVDNNGEKYTGTFLKVNENQIGCEESDAKVERRNTNCIGTQTNFGPQESLHTIPQNTTINAKSEQWPKKMLEIKTRLKELTEEIDLLNRLLLTQNSCLVLERFRQDKWPQRPKNI